MIASMPSSRRANLRWPALARHDEFQDDGALNPSARSAHVAGPLSRRRARQVRSIAPPIPRADPPDLRACALNAASIPHRRRRRIRVRSMCRTTRRRWEAPLARTSPTRAAWRPLSGTTSASRVARSQRDPAVAHSRDGADGLRERPGRSTLSAVTPRRLTDIRIGSRAMNTMWLVSNGQIVRDRLRAVHAQHDPFGCGLCEVRSDVAPQGDDVTTARWPTETPTAGVPAGVEDHPGETRPYLPRMVITGHDAVATRRPATLPTKNFANPVRPCVPTTSTSARLERAALTTC